jgi:cysteine-rich repeat protein
MKLRSLLGAALAATAVLIGVQGCGSSSDATPGTGVHCTPGNYVFCRCADRAEGTKLCKDDGASFEPCTTGTAGVCVGGEVTDPGTGNPVPPDQVPPTPIEAGPPGSAVDACPGQPTAVTPGAAIIIDGDTTGAASDLKGKTGACAVGDGGPDHVYHLQPTGTGSLDIQLQGLGALNALIYLRGACADETTQTACAPPLGAAKLVKLQANVIAGHDYFLVVDGASGSAGKYELTLKLTTGSFCGDGKVDPGEACDDINKVDGDGCSPSCKAVNGDPAAADCTTPHPVHMWKGTTVSGTGSTTTYGNSFAKPGTSCDPAVGSNLAPDHVYEVTAHDAGILKVTMTPTDAAYNVQLVARKTCTDPNTQAGDTITKCNAQSAGVAEVLTIPVTAGEKVYVAADGALNAKGSYTIKFELP